MSEARGLFNETSGIGKVGWGVLSGLGIIGLTTVVDELLPKYKLFGTNLNYLILAVALVLLIIIGYVSTRADLLFYLFVIIIVGSQLMYVNYKPESQSQLSMQ